MFQENAQYVAVVTAASLTTSQAGTRGIGLHFKTDDGPVDYTLWLTEGNRENVLRSLDALGVEEPRQFDIVRGLDPLVGAQCLLTFQQQEYNGRTSMRVRWINPLRARVTEADVDAAQRFFGRRAEATSVKQSAAAPAYNPNDFAAKSAAMRNPAPVIKDEEVPF